MGALRQVSGPEDLEAVDQSCTQPVVCEFDGIRTVEALRKVTDLGMDYQRVGFKQWRVTPTEPAEGEATPAEAGVARIQRALRVLGLITVVFLCLQGLFLAARSLGYIGTIADVWGALFAITTGLIANALFRYRERIVRVFKRVT